jgi:hypothetical protein
VARAWKRTKTPDDVRARIHEDVPPGSPKEDAAAWLEREGIEFSDEGDALRFVLNGPSRGLFVGVKWLVAMRFEGGRLAAVDVEEGLTGP